MATKQKIMKVFMTLLLFIFTNNIMAQTEEKFVSQIINAQYQQDSTYLYTLSDIDSANYLMCFHTKIIEWTLIDSISLISTLKDAIDEISIKDLPIQFKNKSNKEWKNLNLSKNIKVIVDMRAKECTFVNSYSVPLFTRNKTYAIIIQGSYSEEMKDSQASLDIYRFENDNWKSIKNYSIYR